MDLGGTRELVSESRTYFSGGGRRLGRSPAAATAFHSGGGRSRPGREQ